MTESRGRADFAEFAETLKVNTDQIVSMTTGTFVLLYTPNCSAPD